MAGARRRTGMGVVLCAGLTVASPSARAIVENVGASVQMRIALSIGEATGMSFGTIDFEGTHGGYLRLGTDGSLALSDGASGVVLDEASAAAGVVRVSGDGQSNIEISCESSGTLGDGEGNVLPLLNVEHAVDTGVAFGDGTPCQGLGASPSVFSLASNPAPAILLGGEVDLSGNAIAAAGTYDAAAAMGGTSIRVRIVYQ